MPRPANQFICLMSVAVLLGLRPAAAAESTARDVPSVQSAHLAFCAWPMTAGTSWIYEGTIKWTSLQGGEVKSTRLRWTNSVEWAGSNQQWHVAAVRDSVHHLAWYEPGEERGASVFVLTSNQVYEIHTEGTAASRVLAERLLNGISSLPDTAMLQLHLPLARGKTFAIDGERADHWYCWHVTGSTRRQLKIRGVAPGIRAQVFSLEYRTNPDHQLVDFVPGLGIVKYSYEHHGTVAAADVRLVEYRISKDNF